MVRPPNMISAIVIKISLTKPSSNNTEIGKTQLYVIPSNTMFGRIAFITNWVGEKLFIYLFSIMTIVDIEQLQITIDI